MSWLQGRIQDFIFMVRASEAPEAREIFFSSQFVLRTLAHTHWINSKFFGLHTFFTLINTYL